MPHSISTFPSFSRIGDRVYHYTVWNCTCGDHGTGGPKGAKSHLYWARRRGEQIEGEDRHRVELSGTPNQSEWRCLCGKSSRKPLSRWRANRNAAAHIRAYGGAP